MYITLKRSFARAFPEGLEQAEMEFMEESDD